MDTTEKILLIKKLSDCLANLSFTQIPATSGDILNFVNSHLYGVVQRIGSNDNLCSLFRSLSPFFVYELKGRLAASFIILKMPSEDSFLIAGPCITEPFSENFLTTIIYKNKNLSSCRAALRHYYQNLPVLSPITLHHFGKILGECIFETTDIPYCTLAGEENSFRDQSLLFIYQYEKLLPMRLLEHRYERSAALICAVKQGNLSLAERLFQSLITDISQIHRNKNPLRNAQNLCIIMNSLLHFSLQEADIHPYLLDKLSNEIAIKIENTTSYTGLQKLCDEILRKYCELVQNHHYKNVKPLIREAIIYTLSNLSDNLSVQIVAGSLHVNPDYLSHLFVQETGIHFAAFINQERIKQAASLLLHTHSPTKQIALAVGYNNISYFSKEFQKQNHMTPSQYRKNMKKT